MAGLVVSVVVLMRGLVIGRSVIVTNRVEAPVSSRQRRQVELPVARAIAEQRVRTSHALVPASMGLGVVIIGVVVMFADIDVMLPLLFGGLEVVAVPALVLDTAVHARQARRFLKQHA